MKFKYFYLSLFLLSSFCLEATLIKLENDNCMLDYSNKGVVGYLTWKTEGISSENIDLFDINKDLKEFKHKKFHISPDKELGELKEEEKSIIQTLQEYSFTAPASTWNEFQKALKGRNLSPSTMAEIYKKFNIGSKYTYEKGYLKAINFSGCQFLEEKWRRLSSLLDDLPPSLIYLDFSNCSLTLEDLESLIHYSRQRDKSLEYINISRNSFTPEDAIKFLSSTILEERYSELNINTLKKFALWDDPDFQEKVEEIPPISWQEHHNEFWDFFKKNNLFEHLPHIKGDKIEKLRTGLEKITLV